jgi:hypothetical protein
VYRAGVVLALTAALLTACSGSDDGPVSPSATTAPATAPTSTPTSTLVPDLDTYTDRGDGCQQVVSAIGYAEQAMHTGGQDAGIVLDDALRSRLSAVGGTIALEMDDFPSTAVRRLAPDLQRLAERSGAFVDERDRAGLRERASIFRLYRREAPRLVRLCSDATKRAAGPTSSPVSPAPSRRVKLPSSPATEGPTIP